MDFMGRADVTYNTNTYSLSGQYKLMGNSLTSSASWVCPHRSMQYEMSASSENGRMSASSEFKWDVANNKKVSPA